MTNRIAGSIMKLFLTPFTNLLPNMFMFFPNTISKYHNDVELLKSNCVEVIFAYFTKHNIFVLLL